ncbi:hypothetical protein S2M10_41510 [Sphingomonas sp. S2M10]|uniref:porin n=1 Tax=Sphingomonas sp. S2M10 TaxID=2705010 RepID=UPI0016B78147|nr:porin [Sphingomonas sp. S2M10]NLS29131.1 hypothetical protein [Sphingomonas sp. S2M10]
MRLVRWMSGLGLGALCAAGLLVAPTLQAQERDRALKAAVRPAPLALQGAGGFTPAAADPKLAAMLARSGMNGAGFRFTPAESRTESARGVTVAVRAASNRAVDAGGRVASAKPASVSLAPIAYNLGVAVGWRRFAVSGDVTHIDMAGVQPGSRDRAEVALSYAGKRLSGRLAASEDRPLAGTPVLIGDKPSYAFDLGGSYAVSRRLDVTAGVRYKSERDRLTQFSQDTRRESQSIYIGTAFHF